MTGPEPRPLSWCIERMRELESDPNGSIGSASGIVAAAALNENEWDLGLVAFGRKHGWPNEPNAANLAAWAQELDGYLQVARDDLRPELREMAQALVRMLRRASARLSN